MLPNHPVYWRPSGRRAWSKPALQLLLPDTWVRVSEGQEFLQLNVLWWTLDPRILPKMILF